MAGYATPPWDGTGVPPGDTPIPDTALDFGYDPGEHTVAEVQAYLEANPDQTEHVLDRERAGKARSTLIGA